MSEVSVLMSEVYVLMLEVSVLMLQASVLTWQSGFCPLDISVHISCLSQKGNIIHQKTLCLKRLLRNFVLPKWLQIVKWWLWSLTTRPLQCSAISYGCIHSCSFPVHKALVRLRTTNNLCDNYSLFSENLC